MWELINDAIVELEYCLTSENVADIFIKALGAEQLQQHLRRLGVGPIPSQLNGLTIEGACQILSMINLKESVDE